MVLLLFKRNLNKFETDFELYNHDNLELDFHTLCGITLNIHKTVLSKKLSSFQIIILE